MRATPDVDAAQEVLAEAWRLDRAEHILGRAFADRRLLLRALTHTSFLNEHASAVGHNEVLELVGDAVLSLATLDRLVQASPDADEGELTERRAAHVSEPTLAAAAESSGLSTLVRVGKSIVHLPTSSAADAMEAVFGAVYEDAGFDAAAAVIAHLLGEPPAAATTSIKRNGKRDLQERLQRLFGEAPGYTIERGPGPNHAPTFVAAATFRGAALGTGTGANKSAATEAAALDALDHLTDDDALRVRFGAARDGKSRR